MPTYDYLCVSCGHTDVRFLKLAQLDIPQDCPSCAMTMHRKVSLPMIQGDYESYDCPITGRRISGRQQHQENLKKHGCRLLETGETQEYMKASERRQQDAEKQIDQLVEKTAQTLGINA